MTAATGHGVVGVCEVSDEVRLVRPHCRPPKKGSPDSQHGAAAALPEAGLSVERHRRYARSAMHARIGDGQQCLFCEASRRASEGGIKDGNIATGMDIREACRGCETEVPLGGMRRGAGRLRVVLARPGGARGYKMAHILLWGCGAIAAVDISDPGQDLYPIARPRSWLAKKSGRSGAEVVGGGPRRWMWSAPPEEE